MERDRSDGAQRLFAIVAASTTRCLPTAGDDWPEESEAAELEIDREFRRKMAGTDHLARNDRLPARRTIRAWRRAALKAVREMRAAARHAARERRRLAHPVPS